MPSFAFRLVEGPLETTYEESPGSPAVLVRRPEPRALLTAEEDGETRMLSLSLSRFRRLQAMGGPAERSAEELLLWEVRGFGVPDDEARDMVAEIAGKLLVPAVDPEDGLGLA